MDIVKLEVTTRDSNLSAKKLRDSKMVPCVYYGKGEKNLSLQAEYQPLRQVYLKAGQSSLVELVIDGKTKKKVLIQDVQIHPISMKIEHVDFMHVNLKEEITAHVPIVVVGVSPAVKDFGGVMNIVKDTVEVKCLPTDIPHELEVDISSIVDVASSINVKDLQLPNGVVVLDNPDDVVVIVNPPRVEEKAGSVSEESEGGEGGVENEGEEESKGSDA